MIQIIPAIDIIGGKCVRLTQGDYSTQKTYDASPLDMALRYEDCGVRRLHLVDLDGAKASEPVNLRTLEAIASRCPMELEWGGGIAQDRHLKSVFDAGATQAIIGSVAVLEPELMQDWLLIFGGYRVVLGADLRNGKVAVRGWQEDSAKDIDSLLEQFIPAGLEQLICTDISRDGMLEGPSFDLYAGLQAKYPSVTVTVSGGVSCMADIEKLDAMGLRRVITGKAVYEGRITLEDIRRWSQNA
jgi:phosphoribosylformimino-5-aminoimidazole carboxamide ribotide isomerase